MEITVFPKSVKYFMYGLGTLVSNRLCMHIDSNSAEKEVKRHRGLALLESRLIVQERNRVSSC